MSDTITITEQEKSMFDYLNELRESGVTNMFGAGEYLTCKFGIDKYEARSVLSKWMSCFNEDGYDHLTVTP